MRTKKTTNETNKEEKNIYESKTFDFYKDLAQFSTIGHWSSP
jgi:hypothetical protein